MAADGLAELRIDIVSDVMCPWCIVGYRQLQQALDEAGISADIHWHPFELNPQMALEGENLRAHLMGKYGISEQDSIQARQRLTSLGADLGIEFNFTDDSRIYNTFAAHQLLHWAEDKGLQHALKQALFEAHFTGQRDMSDVDVLLEVAEQVGLDREEAANILSDGRHAGEVRAKQRYWMENGIQGVPAMIFNRKHLVTGAQGTENYSLILKQVIEEAA